MTDTWPVKRCIIIIISGRCIESFLGNVPVNEFSKIGLHSYKLWPKIKGVVFSLKHDVHVGIGCENLPTGVIRGWVWRKHQKIRKLKNLTIRWDHPRRHTKMSFYLVGGRRALVVSFWFHQNRLGISGFRAVGVEIYPISVHWPLAYRHLQHFVCLLPYKSWYCQCSSLYSVYANIIDAIL